MASYDLFIFNGKTKRVPSVGLTIDFNTVRFNNGSNYIGLKAPASIGANLDFTLPNADGTNGQILKTNGAGVWSFITPPATGALQDLSNLTATSINQSLIPQTIGQNLGSNANRWGETYGQSYVALGNSFNILNGEFFVQTGQTLPSGASSESSVKQAAGSTGANFAVFTQNNGSGSAGEPTNNIRLESGNRTGGTGNSGDIVLQTGTATGTRGKIRFQEVSVVGQSWVANDTTGGGNWAHKNYVTSIKTANYTAVAWDEVMADTLTTGAFAVTLPAAPVLGDRVKVLDMAGNFATANLTLNPNGLKINGSTSNFILNTNNIVSELVYSNATYGWIIKL